MKVLVARQQIGADEEIGAGPAGRSLRTFARYASGEHPFWTVNDPVFQRSR